MDVQMKILWEGLLKGRGAHTRVTSWRALLILSPFHVNSYVHFFVCLNNGNKLESL